MKESTEKLVMEEGVIKKPTYEQMVRKAAGTRLATTKYLTGRDRRESFDDMDQVVRVGSEPKDDSLRLQQRFASRPIAALGKWHRRVTRRLVTVEKGIEAAMEAGLTKLVDVLSIKRDRFKEIRTALADAINARNERSKFIGNLNKDKTKTEIKTT